LDGTLGGTLTVYSVSLLFSKVGGICSPPMTKVFRVVRPTERRTRATGMRD